MDHDRGDMRLVWDDGTTIRLTETQVRQMGGFLESMQSDCESNDDVKMPRGTPRAVQDILACMDAIQSKGTVFDPTTEGFGRFSAAFDLAYVFLQVNKPITDYMREWFASAVAGKTPQQIRDMAGIKNDFTPEEKQDMARRIVWKKTD